jgi:two-component system, OmpR family, sensor kinase
MTAWYGGVLALFVGAFAVAVYLEASRVVWNSAADRVSGVAQAIDGYLRSQASGPFGSVSAVTALSDQSTLDTFVGPGLFVEVYNAKGYRIAKSSNLGDDDLPLSGYRPWRGSGAAGEWGIQTTAVGPVLVKMIALNGPAGSAPGAVATVIVADSLTAVVGEEQRFGVELLISLALALSAIVAVSALLARGTVSPIDQIATALADIGGEDLAKRLNWKGRKDELGELAASFDAMLARLEAAFSRERRLIADASHELKTPLTVINANAQMLERWADRDESLRREAIATIRAESASMARVLNALLTLAKTDNPDALNMEPVEASSVVRDAATALRGAAEAKGLTLAVDVDGPAWVRGEPGLLRQLVTNLTENAIKFTSKGGISVSLHRNGASAAIAVTDSGPGIPADALPHVFDRFYRADPARSRAVEGTGLGLAVVRNIVRVHAGDIAVSSEEGRGATFSVTLPLIATDPPA